MTVLATARHPQAAQALGIVLEDASLRVSVGQKGLRSLPWPESCPLRIAVRDGELRLLGQTVMLQTETPEDMPVVTGLFSGLDLRAGEPPKILVRTRAYASSWTARQMLAGALAVVFALSTLILLARPAQRFGVLARLARWVLSAWQARDATDAVVIVVLLAWWIIAPAFFDDGWFWVIDRVFGDLGTAGLYYRNWGVNQPLGYWLEWLRHWIVGSTNDLVFMRLPTLVVLLATWLLCRRCLRMVVDPLPSGVRWVLAGAFLVAMTSWGMTIRPEPFVALLAVACLAAMASFMNEPRLSPLAIAIPAAVLAATAHPAGIVAASPMLAVTPNVTRWLFAGGRTPSLALGALLSAGLALTLVVFTLDADLQSRIGDSRLLSEGEYFHEPWREYIRYVNFDRNGGETATRRLSLALLLLSVAAWLTARRGGRRDAISLPARSVAIGLLLLAFVPSKWPWHFGALLGVGAVAVAAEVTRLTRESETSQTWPIRSIVALILVGAGTSWAWRAQGEWSPLGLQEANWGEGFGYQKSAALFLVAAAFGIVIWRSRRIQRFVLRPQSIAGVTTGALFGVVGVTIAVLVHDAAVSPWSPPRQNIEALAGGNSCGLAHQLQSSGDLVQLLSDPDVRTLLVPEVAVYFPCATIPSVGGGLVEIPRLVAFESSPWPLRAHDGPFAAISDLYELRRIARGTRGARGVEVLSVAGRIRTFVRVDAVRRD